jgi:hypothetical protein
VIVAVPHSSASRNLPPREPRRLPNRSRKSAATRPVAPPILAVLFGVNQGKTCSPHPTISTAFPALHSIHGYPPPDMSFRPKQPVFTLPPGFWATVAERRNPGNHLNFGDPHCDKRVASHYSLLSCAKSALCFLQLTNCFFRNCLVFKNFCVAPCYFPDSTKKDERHGPICAISCAGRRLQPARLSRLALHLAHGATGNIHWCGRLDAALPAWPDFPASRLPVGFAACG